MLSKILLTLLLFITTYARASPVTGALLQNRDISNASSITKRTTGATEDDVPLCHFRASLQRNCDGDNYKLRIHTITDFKGNPISNVKNNGVWINNVQSREVEIGYLASYRLAADYNEGRDEIKFYYEYANQVWRDSDGHCGQREGWQGDNWNGDRNHCPHKWDFYFRRFECGFPCTGPWK